MKAALRVLVCLCLSGSIGVSARPPPRASGSPAQDLVYPGATPVRLDLHDSAPGLAADAAVFFVTSDPLVAVARFFHDRWRAQGLVTTADGEFLEEGVIGAFDVIAGRQHAVVLRRLEGGRTLGFVTEVPLAALWEVARSRGAAPQEQVRVGPSQEAGRARVEVQGGKARVQVTARGQSVTWTRAVVEDRP